MEIDEIAAALGLTEAERRVYDDTFNHIRGSQECADGDAVRDLFMRTGLSIDQLAIIWDLSDRTHRGALDRADCYLALRLVSLAQADMPIQLETLGQVRDLPLPRFQDEVAQATESATQGGEVAGGVNHSPNATAVVAPSAANNELVVTVAAAVTSPVAASQADSAQIAGSTALHPSSIVVVSPSSKTRTSRPTSTNNSASTTPNTSAPPSPAAKNLPPSPALPSSSSASPSSSTVASASTSSSTSSSSCPTTSQGEFDLFFSTHEHSSVPPSSSSATPAAPPDNLTRSSLHSPQHLAPPNRSPVMFHPEATTHPNGPGGDARKRRPPPDPPFAAGRPNFESGHFLIELQAHRTRQEMWIDKWQAFLANNEINKEHYQVMVEQKAAMLVLEDYHSQLLDQHIAELTLTLCHRRQQICDGNIQIVALQKQAAKSADSDVSTLMAAVGALKTEAASWQKGVSRWQQSQTAQASELQRAEERLTKSTTEFQSIKQECDELRRTKPSHVTIASFAASYNNAPADEGDNGEEEQPLHEFAHEPHSTPPGDAPLTLHVTTSREKQPHDLLAPLGEHFDPSPVAKEASNPPQTTEATNLSFEALANSRVIPAIITPSMPAEAKAAATTVHDSSASATPASSAESSPAMSPREIQPSPISTPVVPKGQPQDPPLTQETSSNMGTREGSLMHHISTVAASPTPTPHTVLASLQNSGASPPPSPTPSLSTLKSALTNSPSGFRPISPFGSPKLLPAHEMSNSKTSVASAPHSLMSLAPAQSQETPRSIASWSEAASTLSPLDFPPMDEFGMDSSTHPPPNPPVFSAKSPEQGSRSISPALTSSTTTLTTSVRELASTPLEKQPSSTSAPPSHEQQPEEEPEAPTQDSETRAEISQGGVSSENESPRKRQSADDAHQQQQTPVTNLQEDEEQQPRSAEADGSEDSEGSEEAKQPTEEPAEEESVEQEQRPVEHEEQPAEHEGTQPAEHEGEQAAEHEGEQAAGHEEKGSRAQATESAEVPETERQKESDKPEREAAAVGEDDGEDHQEAKARGSSDIGTAKEGRTPETQTASTEAQTAAPEAQTTAAGQTSISPKMQTTTSSVSSEAHTTTASKSVVAETSAPEGEPQDATFCEFDVNFDDADFAPAAPPPTERKKTKKDKSKEGTLGRAERAKMARKASRRERKTETEPTKTGSAAATTDPMLAGIPKEMLLENANWLGNYDDNSSGVEEPEDDTPGGLLGSED